VSGQQTLSCHCEGALSANLSKRGQQFSNRLIVKKLKIKYCSSCPKGHWRKQKIDDYVCHFFKPSSKTMLQLIHISRAIILKSVTNYPEVLKSCENLSQEAAHQNQLGRARFYQDILF
jgi:hypothetical protein